MRRYVKAKEMVEREGSSEGHKYTAPEWAGELVAPVVEELIAGELELERLKAALAGLGDGTDDGGTANPDHGEGR